MNWRLADRRTWRWPGLLLVIGSLQGVCEAPAAAQTTGPPPGPPSNPAMPPPLISGRVSLEPDRAGQRALRELVLGKKVRLEFDREADEKDRRVYVFLEDGTLVNAEMLRMGRARVDTSQAFERLAEFKAIEERAKEERRGIWARPSR